MRNVLLVDDEMLVRTDIKLMLKEYSDKICICAEASNGIEALSIIADKRPDIVLSDMRMPEMDGLELSRRIHVHYKNTAFIALSNFDDFEYVRGVLKNGGSDYLLKHELSPALLSSSIMNVELPDRPEHDDIPDAGNLISLQHRFILGLLAGNSMSDENLTANLKMLSIPVGTKNIIPIVMSIDNYMDKIQSADLKRKNTIEFSTIQICNDILHSCCSGIITHIEKELYCILISMQNISSIADRENLLHSITLQLSSNLKRYMNLSVSMSIGPLSSNLSDIADSFSIAERSLSQKFFEGNNSIIYATSNLIAQPTEHEYHSGLEKDLASNLTSYFDIGDIENAMMVINQIFTRISENKLTITDSKLVFVDLTGLISNVIRKYNMNYDMIFEKVLLPNQMLEQYTTIDEIHDWFIQVSSAFCSERSRQLHSNSKYVQLALSFIRKEYDKPIMLQDVADHVGISTGYLSSYFKSEVGTGFSDYLNGLRIERACSLIKDGQHDFHAIALKCGFQDYSYFFRVFKKKTGKTPKDYFEHQN